MTKEAVAEKVVEVVENVAEPVENVAESVPEQVIPEAEKVLGKAGNAKVIFGTIIITGAVLIGGTIIKNKILNKIRKNEEETEEKGEE